VATRFEQLSPDNIPSYTDGAVVTPEIESIGTPGSAEQFPSQTEWEPEPDEVTTVQKKLGANQKVIDGLSRVAFATGCEMSDAIAYIRYWSRSGVTQKAAVSMEQAFTLPADTTQNLKTELSNLYAGETDFGSAQYSFPENYRPSDAFKGVPVNTFNPGYDFSTPTFNPSIEFQDTRSGTVYSANPSGITQNAPATSSSDAVWQFLFNPEELQLSSGPEYNKAETWGVSDPANSGQPLSWRNNRNRKLTFNKVLLHGYSFGKRVDSLEKGLQDLFMAREGEGSDGPPVLEFVWGKRHFGPCVIQNIQVREKAWDKGLLVNAEVSFDLEQVPEWTINDGFVDVLRPGRQPLINDPVLPPSTQAADDSGDTEVEKKDKPGGGGGEPDVTGDPYQCNGAIRLSQVMQKQYDELGVVLRNISIFGGANPLSSAEAEYNKWANRYVNISEGRFPSGLYKPGSNYLISLTDYFKYVVSKLKATVPNCTRENIEGTLSELKDSLPGNAGYIRGLQFINGCQGRIKQYTDDWLREEGKGEGQCVSLRKSRESKEKQLQESKKCDKYKNNSGCSNFQLMSRITCAGITYTCVRAGSGWSGNSYVWRQRG